MEEKPKRTLSPEALKKLQLAREKALEAKRQNKEITKYEKETSRKEKQQRREQTYNAIIELKQKISDYDVQIKTMHTDVLTNIHNANKAEVEKLKITSLE